MEAIQLNKHTMQIIDPHVHLFDLAKGQYLWLKPENEPFWPDKAVINKNFSASDLSLSAPLSLYGFVHIEAGFDNLEPWREIAWLEQNCQDNFRAVAMLDITLSPAMFNEQLNKVIQYKSVVGTRFILDEQASIILCNENTKTNLSLLAQYNLSFELQMSLMDNNAVDHFIKLLAKIPNLKICINHAGWPPKESENMHLWQKNLKQLSEFSNLFIKCSGYEMAKRDYTLAWQLSLIDIVIKYFTTRRTMLASNFPLCLFRQSYNDTWQANTRLKSLFKQELNNDAFKDLCFTTAKRFYQF